MGFLLPPSLSLLLFLIMLSVGAPRTDAWGADGHSMICNITWKHLSEEARTAVDSLLGGEKLEDECSWADGVRRQYRWSDTLHYVANPGRTCDFDRSRDCPNNDCVVGAIDDEALYLRENYYRCITPPTSSWDLTLSLKFLAHFVGDVHQPLHVGFKRDSGGVAIKNIKISWGQKRPRKVNHQRPRKVNHLHRIWDTEIIRTAIRGKYKNKRERMIASIESRIRPSDWTRGVDLSPALYASESIQVACADAYKDTADQNVQSYSTLDEKYYKTGLAVVEGRIAKGAVRLAALLNDIFRLPETNPPSSQVSDELVY